VSGVDAFDLLVQEWLHRGDGKLKAVLLKHADQGDKGRIELFFKQPLPFPDEFVSSSGLLEGALKRVYVNAYERNPAARSACIAHYGPTCVVCGFSFGAVYGPLAEGFIHVHHLKPLAEVGEQYEVDPISDLRPVCANCHAIIHLGDRCRRIEEARDLIDPRVLAFWRSFISTTQ
jgi:hypothetical protein